MPRRANTSALPPSGRESDQNFSDMQSFLSSDPDIAPEQMHRTLHPTPALSPLPTRDEFYMTGITRITPPPPPPDGYRCSICIETLIGEYVLLRRCGHVFHATCIRMWFQGTPRAPACHMDCPLCRTVLYEAVKRPSALSIQGTGSESGETAEMLEPANYRSGQDSEQLQRLAADWGRFGQHLRPAYATPMINVPHQSAVATAEEQLRQLYASTIPQQTQGNVLQYDLLRGTTPETRRYGNNHGDQPTNPDTRNDAILPARPVEVHGYSTEPDRTVRRYAEYAPIRPSTSPLVHPQRRTGEGPAMIGDDLEALHGVRLTLYRTGWTAEELIEYWRIFAPLPND